MKICGVLLIGGRSSRMGTDKAYLKWKGQSFATVIAKALQEHCQEVICAGANRAPAGFIHLPDAIKDAGPLAGVVAALESGRADFYLVTSCDVPAIDAADFAALCTLKKSASYADGSRRWPLPCLLVASTAALARARLEQRKRSLQGFLDAAGAELLPLGERAWRLKGVNQPEELRALVQRTRSGCT